MTTCHNAYMQNITGDRLETLSENAWQRHCRALQSTDPHVLALRKLITGLHEYADAHQKEFDSPIGDDCILGDSWRDIALAVIDLLNGPTGNLDCGTVDHTIREMARAVGVDLEE